MTHSSAGACFKRFTAMGFTSTITSTLSLKCESSHLSCMKTLLTFASPEGEWSRPFNHLHPCGLEVSRPLAKGSLAWRESCQLPKRFRWKEGWLIQGQREKKEPCGLASVRSIANLGWRGKPRIYSFLPSITHTKDIRGGETRFSYLHIPILFLRLVSTADESFESQQTFSISHLPLLVVKTVL